MSRLWFVSPRGHALPDEPESSSLQQWYGLGNRALVDGDPEWHPVSVDCQSCSPVDYLGQSRPVDAQIGSCFAHLQIQGREDVVPQSEARVGWVEHRTHRHLSGSPGSPPGWHRRFQKQKQKPDASCRSR